MPLITPPTFFAGPPIAAVAEAGRTMAVPLITPLGVASLEASKPTLPCLLFVFGKLARSGTARPIALVAVPGLLLPMALLPVVAAIPTAFFTASAPFIGLLLPTPEISCVSMPTELLAGLPVTSPEAAGPRAARRAPKFLDGPAALDG